MATKGGLLQEWAQAAQNLLIRSEWGMGLILFLGSWLLMFLLGGPMIHWLRQKRWKKDVVSDAEAWQVREDTPDTHQAKQGTPSMGGIGIISVACGLFGAFVLFLVILGILAGNFTRPRGFWIEIFLTFLIPLIVGAHALLGFADDWSKASGRGGLRARAKLLGQWILASFFVLVLSVLVTQKVGGPSTDFPSLEFGHSELYLFSVAFLILLMVGVSNAVNLTDGIDGLAAGLALQTGAFFWLTQPDFDSHIGVVSNLFWAALAGSCLGFVAYNKYPAKVFMGDTGSLALGAAVGAGAIMTQSVFLLPFIAFIYFVEMFSVTLQVLYFKYTKRKYGEGRRIFRRAPLHHHFELGGWSEWRVVGTFLAINLLTSAIGLILWQLNILPRFP
ncbi:MAG TPA: phospho-N-acetylmuramoyl-pentapeptide-transferase [Abditibacteriaceae bacterium]